jgi:hypothetical protein
MHTTTHLKPSILTPQLLADLLDPGLTLSEVADRHQIPLLDLPALVASDTFRAHAAALAEAESIRETALAPLRRARALHVLTTLTAREPTSATQAESARRAATTLLKETCPPSETPAMQSRDSSPSSSRPPSTPFTPSTPSTSSTPSPSTTPSQPSDPDNLEDPAEFLEELRTVLAAIVANVEPNAATPIFAPPRPE